MLQSMRELSKSWIFKSLMALLVVSFGIWGIGDMFRGNPQQRTVASVGSIDIPVIALEQRFQIDLPEARRAFGPDLTVEQARKIGVLERTLKLMIEEQSFDLETARLGLNVPSEHIMSKLAKEPQLRGKDGKFDTQRWHQILSRAGMNEQMFLDFERRQAARQLLFTALNSEMPTPKIAIDSLYQARGAKRILEILTLRHDSIKALPAPQESELEQYYKNYELRYQVPEYRDFTIGVLDVTTASDDVAITEEQIKAAYEQRSAELTKPETRDLNQIVFQDEAKANAFYDEVQKSSFTSAAKAKGLTVTVMEKISEKTILPDLFATVFAQESGQVTKPIKSSLGWHVVLIKAVHKGGKPELAAIRDDIKKMLQEEHVGDLVASQVNKLDDMIAAGQSLEECADTLKMRLHRVTGVDQNGLDKAGKEVKDIPNEIDTLRSAYELNQGETGQVIDSGKGQYYVVRLDQITPAHTQSFEEAKAKVTADLMAEKQKAKAAEEAEKIAKTLREGKTATSYASHPGMNVSLSKPLSMLGQIDKSIPAQAVGNIFKMKKGDVITATGNDAEYILRLSDIVPVNPDKPEESRLIVADTLSENLPYNLVEQYILHLRKAFPVRIHNDVVQNLKNRGDIDK